MWRWSMSLHTPQSHHILSYLISHHISSYLIISYHTLSLYIVCSHLFVTSCNSSELVDVCDTNLPPINTKFWHSSMMISLSTGDLAPNNVPCAYRWNTSKPKHWQSLCDTCNDSCVYTTWHAILPTHLRCFWRVRLAMGLKSPTKHYMVSRAVHRTQWSSHRIDCNRDSTFGLRSCWKHDKPHHQCKRLLYIYGHSPSLLKQTTAE